MEKNRHQGMRDRVPASLFAVIKLMLLFLWRKWKERAEEQQKGNNNRMCFIALYTVWLQTHTHKQSCFQT